MILPDLMCCMVELSGLDFRWNGHGTVEEKSGTSCFFGVDTWVKRGSSNQWIRVHRETLIHLAGANSARQPSIRLEAAAAAHESIDMC